MTSARLIGISLLLLPGLLAGQGKKKHAVPAMFDSAQYVWVEAEDGDAFKPGLLPEDREAIGDVMQALRDWHRYVLTVDRRGADLLFVVRKGRLASARIAGNVGNGYPANDPLGQASHPGQQQRPGGIGMGAGVGAEAGPPDDMLEVYLLNSDGSRGAKIWQRSFPNGLNPPDVLLVLQLRKAVDKEYPMKAASGPPAGQPGTQPNTPPNTQPSSQPDKP